MQLLLFTGKNACDETNLVFFDTISYLEKQRKLYLCKKYHRGDVEKIITLSTILSHDNFIQNNHCDSNGINFCKC